jgi:hypothetical protein
MDRDGGEGDNGDRQATDEVENEKLGEECRSAGSVEPSREPDQRSDKTQAAE